MPTEQGLRFHEDHGAPPVGQDRGEDHQDQAVPHSEARPPDMSRGDEKLLAKEGVLGEELHLGAREIRKEATTRAASLVWCGCECFPDNPPTGTVNAARSCWTTQAAGWSARPSAPRAPRVAVPLRGRQRGSRS